MTIHDTKHDSRLRRLQEIQGFYDLDTIDTKTGQYPIREFKLKA